ncbi:MAG: DnaJ domain-containing protein [Blastocatellia bacterium]|nr:DnaJ domain-containing protein [Blastocatellia bacterium]
MDRETGVLVLFRDGDVAARISIDNGRIVDLESAAWPRVDGDSAAEHLRSSLVGLFALPDLPGTVERGSVAVTTAAGMPIADVLLEGIKASEDTSRVEAWLGGRDDVLELVSNPYSRFSEAMLGPSEGYFMSRIDRPMSVSAMIDEVAVDADLVLRIACAMRYAGVLTPSEATKAWIGDRGPFEVSASGVSEHPEGADSDELARAFYLVEEKLRSVQSGADLYAILEVERRASIDRIKASYRELAKTFHPDRHAQLAAFDADIKSRLEIIFTAITNAYSTLGNAKEREAYDTKLHKTDQASAVRSPAAAPVIPKPKPPPRPNPEPAPAPEPKPTIAKGPVKPPMPIPVVAPLPRAPKPPPASAKAAEVKPVEAHSQPVARKEPTAEATAPKSAAPPGPAGPAAKPTVQPDALYDHGAAYAESGDWDRAVQALKRGIAAAPEDARMHAKLGAALASLHGLNKLAEASLRKALELESNSAERFVEVAEVYHQFDRLDDARTLFKRALLIDPQNIEARSALEKLGVPTTSTEPQAGFFQTPLPKVLTVCLSFTSSWPS